MDPQALKLVLDNLKSYESLDQLEKDLERFGDPTGELSEKLAEALKLMYSAIEFGIHIDLFDHSRWRQLSSTPKELDKELARLFGQIRTYIKTRHGISAHRKTQNERRDADIYKLRKQKLTFGQIAQRLGMGLKGDKVAREAFERYTARQESELEEFRQMLPELCTAGCN